MGEQQSSVYMMWKLPSSSVTDNPPPYSENPSNNMTTDEGDPRETTSKITQHGFFPSIWFIYFFNDCTLGLLVVPSAPSNDVVEELPNHVLMVRRSNGTLDSDDFLDAGTPPPSYAEVLACISNPAVNALEENVSAEGNVVLLTCKSS